MEALSLTAAIAQLVQMGVQGVRALRNAVPEYGRFWDDFERELKNDHDVPWDAIRTKSYLQPDFIGWAVEYIAGDDHGRLAMEAHFEALLEPPEGGYLDKQTLIARVSDAARKAANAAASTDRRAALANRQLVIAAVLDATSGLSAQLEVIHTDMIATRDGIEEILSRLPVERDEEVDRAEEREAPRRFSIDDGEIEALLERAGDVFLEKHRQAQATEAMSPDPAPAPERARTPVLPTFPGLEARSQQDHLDNLRAANEGGAANIERIVHDGGVEALATAIRTDGLPLNLDTVVAAARIVSLSGFFAEAEQAYLRAADLDPDAPTRARQLVRASRIADVQGAVERSLEHLEHARRLDSENSTLAIAEARRSSDSNYMLERVAGVEPVDDDERALLCQTRAQAHLALGDEASAKREFEAAKEASETNVSVREFGGILVLHEAQRRAASPGQMQDLPALRETGEMFESMTEDLLRENRPIEAAAIMARAAEAYMLGRRFDRAAAVLARVPAREVLSDEVALTVAETGMICQQPELVLRMLGTNESEPLAQLLRAVAQAEVSGSDETTLREAVALLESFLHGEDHELEKRAAFSLLDLAIRLVEVEWSEEASEIVGGERPETATAMRAERHLLLGEFDEAEAALLPLADDVTYQRRMRDYAAASENWPRVVDRSRQLLRDHHDPSDRLALGHALKHTEGSAAAVTEFLRVARDASADPDVREAGFGAALELVGADRDYGAILELAQEWWDALPESSNALWNVLFAMARLSQHEEAYNLARQHQLDAATPERATLLAEIYFRAAPRPDAVGTIAALSDRFGRRIEALEALTMAAALGADADELDDAVGERVADTISTFEERFPDSHTIKSFPAPQTAEEFEAVLETSLAIGRRFRLRSLTPSATGKLR